MSLINYRGKALVIAVHSVPENADLMREVIVFKLSCHWM